MRTTATRGELRETAVAAGGTHMASNQKYKDHPTERRLYDAVLDEFLAWIEEDHDEWHRRMEKLHKDLEQARQAAKSGASDVKR